MTTERAPIRNRYRATARLSLRIQHTANQYTHDQQASQYLPVPYSTVGLHKHRWNRATATLSIASELWLLSDYLPTGIQTTSLKMAFRPG